MEDKKYLIDPIKPFAESLIWQINRDYYQQTGIDAWRKGTVPHNLTSNAMVGKTYAELVFAFLKDLAVKGQKDETVYILEVGAGHGRLAFHILKHLERLVGRVGLELPKYCFVLSDIVEENLNFFLDHPQFQSYFERGILDVAYFDAIEGKELELRYAKKTILPQSLNQPLLVLANYFFDSLPMDLFYFKDKEIFTCSISLESSENPEGKNATALLENLDLAYFNLPLEKSCYKDSILNEILEEYRELVFNTYLFFPTKGFECIHNLRQLSQKGICLISMDKGFHEIHDLENAKFPDMVTHGSFSFWVNYHALGVYCKKHGGKAMFPEYSTFHLDLGCLLFLSEPETYYETKIAYEHFVNDFGPDDNNSIKQFAYRNIAKMNLSEMIAWLRLSGYDSTLFTNISPLIKQLARKISVNERTRLAQTLHRIWDGYFTLDEDFDMAFEIGGMLYALGYYKAALKYFAFSVAQFGEKADIFYNQALCHYHLREDDLFLKTLKEAKTAFPNYENYKELDKLDLSAP